MIELLKKIYTGVFMMESVIKKEMKRKKKQQQKLTSKLRMHPARASYGLTIANSHFKDSDTINSVSRIMDSEGAFGTF